MWAFQTGWALASDHYRLSSAQTTLWKARNHENVTSRVLRCSSFGRTVILAMNFQAGRAVLALQDGIV